MSDTIITRNGTFDPHMLGGLESQLRGTPQLPPTAQVYGSPTGLYVLWPDPGLTNPQKTGATNIINAYTQPNDFAQLPPQIQKIHQYSQLPSPTNAQVVMATQLMAKAIVRLYSGKDNIDGVDISN